MSNKNYRSISISKATEAKLAALKHKGQSWDGVIQELLQKVGK